VRKTEAGNEYLLTKTVRTPFSKEVSLPPCPQITWQIVLHGREVSPFYKNLKPINRRPAVFEHNPVVDILTQLTAP